MYNCNFFVKCFIDSKTRMYPTIYIISFYITSYHVLTWSWVNGNHFLMWILVNCTKWTIFEQNPTFSIINGDTFGEIYNPLSMTSNDSSNQSVYSKLKRTTFGRNLMYNRQEIELQSSSNCLVGLPFGKSDISIQPS